MCMCRRVSPRLRSHGLELMLRRELSPASLEQPDSQEAWQDVRRSRTRGGVGVCARCLHHSQAAEEKTKARSRDPDARTRSVVQRSSMLCARDPADEVTIQQHRQFFLSWHIPSDAGTKNGMRRSSDDPQPSR
jgi:hypothetical protein